MSTLNTTIQARISSFLAELDELLRKAALDAVSSALGGRAAAPAPRPAPKAAPRKAAKPAKSAKPAAPARKPAPAAPAASKASAKGAKRSPGLIKKTTEALAVFIKSNPGKRIEQIGAGMNVATKDLALPIKKLLADKRISKKGQKRATTYSGK